MTKKNNNHGGARVGAGNPSKFGEPTENLNIRVPASKKADFRQMFNAILNEWANLKTK